MCKRYRDDDCKIFHYEPIIAETIKIDYLLIKTRHVVRYIELFANFNVKSLIRNFRLILVDKCFRFG